jgi:hypothetical protein
MDDFRVLRLAESVAGVSYPRLELKTTLPGQGDGHDIQVWSVDGEYIRTYLDEEFTNFGATLRTLRGFLQSVNDLEALVRDITVPNPDK